MLTQAERSIIKEITLNYLVGSRLYHLKRFNSCVAELKAHFRLIRRHWKWWAQSELNREPLYDELKYYRPYINTKISNPLTDILLLGAAKDVNLEPKKLLIPEEISLEGGKIS